MLLSRAGCACVAVVLCPHRQAHWLVSRLPHTHSPHPCLQVQIIDFPDAEGPLEFEYDPEWLAVLRATHGLMSLQRRAAPLPRAAPPPSQEQVEEVSWAGMCRESTGMRVTGVRE